MNLDETNSVYNPVRMIEVTDKVIGGPDGPINVALQALTSRDVYLKDHLENLLFNSQAPVSSTTEYFSPVSSLDSVRKIQSDDPITNALLNTIIQSLVNRIEKVKDSLSEVEQVQASSGGYSQVTKLNAFMMKMLEIPTVEDASFCRPPLEVLVLDDDNMTETSTACSFSNGDSSDFIHSDNVDFNHHMMSPKIEYYYSTTSDILSTGYMTETTDYITVSDFKMIKEVIIA